MTAAAGAALSHVALAAIVGRHFAAFALRKFCLLLPWQTRGFRESRAGILFRVETHGRMSHPRGTPVSPDNSNVRNTWPNLVFPDDDFARQYYYVLNW
jgi:hypothetical protein